MAYRPASSVACVVGFRYHAWSASKAWGLSGARVAEWQTCIRCGCERSRVVDRLRPTMGRGWVYREQARGGDLDVE